MERQGLEADTGEFVPGYLLYLLAAASDAASAQFHAHVRTEGLRVPEWRVLACLNDPRRRDDHAAGPIRPDRTVAP